MSINVVPTDTVMDAVNKMQGILDNLKSNLDTPAPKHTIVKKQLIPLKLTINNGAGAGAPGQQEKQEAMVRMQAYNDKCSELDRMKRKLKTKSDDYDYLLEKYRVLLETTDTMKKTVATEAQAQQQQAQTHEQAQQLTTPAKSPKRSHLGIADEWQRDMLDAVGPSKKRGHGSDFVSITGDPFPAAPKPKPTRSTNAWQLQKPMEDEKRAKRSKLDLFSGGRRNTRSPLEPRALPTTSPLALRPLTATSPVLPLSAKFMKPSRSVDLRGSKAKSPVFQLPTARQPQQPQLPRLPRAAASSQETRMDSSDQILCPETDGEGDMMPSVEEVLRPATVTADGPPAAATAAKRILDEGEDSWRKVLDRDPWTGQVGGEKKITFQDSSHPEPRAPVDAALEGDKEHQQLRQRILQAVGDCAQCKGFYSMPGLVLPKRDPSSLCMHKNKRSGGGNGVLAGPATAPPRSEHARAGTPEHYWDIEYFPEIRVAGPEQLRKREESMTKAP
ncbi:hypothetical protein LPJ66_008259 [Kickxella alabastrina]|uniref:Uncharacterized protein n=1 Tax=Kickxella alabastrina TaxID=61397 RepID=A0ACC1IAC7_9FUNG|nr:hypothetical protein LPJ66_008259 [Kickxella alabastrina]